jgi:hypothetical protein
MFQKIECALDEWTTGQHELIHFKEDQYKGTFNQHLKTLNYFHQKMCEMDILPKILQQVYNNGR